MSEKSEVCACLKCGCEVSATKSIEKNGKRYCCEACSDGHRTEASCCNQSCHCG